MAAPVPCRRRGGGRAPPPPSPRAARASGGPFGRRRGGREQGKTAARLGFQRAARSPARGTTRAVPLRAGPHCWLPLAKFH
ncbi:unnamed protein product [Urochloa humidicola]